MTRALDQIVSPHKGNEARALTFGYREDIDWLRAIAVLAVVAFHFEAPAVFGGFVGVDIFFVISGYLITGIILSELKAGNFSFARFYERRVRRLLPALYAMVALTAIPSFHFLLTSERAEFFRSIASVVTFTSNFFFWFQTGYFDHAAVEKPLLHTWSLAVEEQFYLALPITLFLLSRFSRGGRAALPIAFGTLTLASFGLSVWLMRTGGSANAFFMSPPRAWEFLVGGIVALPGFSCAAPRVCAAGGAGRCYRDAGNTDFFVAAGTGISRHQRAVALHWGSAVHLERHRRTDARAQKLFAAQRRKILRPDFLFALSMALAVVCLCPLFQRQPGAGSERQDRTFRAHGCDLLALLAIRRAAVPQPHARADARLRIPLGLREFIRSLDRERRRARHQPQPIGGRRGRGAVRFL